jgi:hypothetical protein
MVILVLLGLLAVEALAYLFPAEAFLLLEV